MGSTVSGGASSVEATEIAAVPGITGVDVVSNATWASMTTAQFAAYRVIILGDATCSGTQPAVAVANSATWSAAITGNQILIGTDEVYHDSQGGRKLSRGGLAFAAAQAGKTGLFASLSCYFHDTAAGTPVTLLNGLGSFTVRGVGCYNNTHIVAAHPALSGITDADLSNWSCSVHEAFDSWPVSYQVLAIARDIGSSYTASDGTVGTPYILAKGAGLVAISDISLTPLTGTNPVGTTHLLTAKVTTSVPSPGTPVASTLVTFKVVSGPDLGKTFSSLTNASGVATWSLVNTGGPGQDIISASFVDSAGRTQTSTLATKDWTTGSTDRTAPSCRLTSKSATGIQVEVQDTGSGIATILATKHVNATMSIPVFSAGVLTPLTVTATKTLLASPAQVELTVTDVAGNVTVCDPVIVRVQVPEAGVATYQTSFTPRGTSVFTDIPQVEGIVSIQNGAQGIRALMIVVNGKRFIVNTLADGAETTVDIRSAMVSGANAVTLVAYGKPNTFADIIIYDGN